MIVLSIDLETSLIFKYIMLLRCINIISMLCTHVDLNFYSLSVTDLCVFAPIPGNQNEERQEDPENEEIGFNISS